MQKLAPQHIISHTAGSVQAQLCLSRWLPFSQPLPSNLGPHLQIVKSNLPVTAKPFLVCSALLLKLCHLLACTAQSAKHKQVLFVAAKQLQSHDAKLTSNSELLQPAYCVMQRVLIQWGQYVTHSILVLELHGTPMMKLPPDLAVDLPSNSPSSPTTLVSTWCSQQ